jgi:hypothetical protein
MLRSTISKIIAFFIIVVLGALSVWNYQCRNLYEKQKTEISGIVGNVIREQARRNMLLPHIVFINADSIDKQKLNDSLINQVSNALTDRYLRSDSSEFSSLQITPILSSPFLRDNRGRYFITEAQAESFKSNLDFLVKQTDTQVANTKEEIGRDIDRLNLWVTIWIGVMGLLGIFIPILINIDASNKLQRISVNADEAKSLAEGASKIINDAQPKIDKIEALESKVTEAEENLIGINAAIGIAFEKAEEANAISKEAEKKSKTLHLVYSINRLELINIRHFKEIEKRLLLQYLEKVLIQIHNDLKVCACHCNEAIVKDSVSELGLRLQQVTYSKLLDPETTSEIVEFVEIIPDIITDYTLENHNRLSAALKKLFEGIAGRNQVPV